MVSRIELTGDPCWRQEHTFPNDEDIAGITLLSWDVDEADDVLFLQEQYKEVVAELQKIFRVLGLQ